jgi:hypothetical protein
MSNIEYRLSAEAEVFQEIGSFAYIIYLVHGVFIETMLYLIPIDQMPKLPECL